MTQSRRRWIRAKLKQLGITFADCAHSFSAGTPLQKRFVARAKQLEREGALEVDEDAAVVSCGDPKAGAYVMCWIWIEREDV